MRNLTVICFILAFFSHPKIVNAQVTFAKPRLGDFVNACASNDFNTYNVDVTFTSESSLTDSNRFIIELSDPTGSFSNPETVFISQPGALSGSPLRLTFQLPEDAAGEAYRIRVRTTSPAATSPRSDSFAGYFRIQNSPFTINGLEQNAVFCSGGSFLLTIDNPGEASTISPLQFPNLTFRWFRQTSETTSVFVSSGNSLAVTEPGTYFAETDYGSCSATSDSSSNRVTVTEIASGMSSATINSSLGNPYCAADGPTILSTTAGSDYQWFKDGVIIQGATSQELEVNELGVFSVNVEFQGCSASASIDLINTSFTAELDVDTENPIDIGTDDTLDVSVIHTAISPEFEWRLNDVIIPDATDSSLAITEGGTYTVIITETVDCVASQTFTFTVTEPFPNVPVIPNFVTPNGDTDNQNWIIPREFVSGTNTRVMIISSQGKVVLDTEDYQNTWPTAQNEIPNITSVYYYIIKKQNQSPINGSITVVR